MFKDDLSCSPSVRLELLLRVCLVLRSLPLFNSQDRGVDFHTHTRCVESILILLSTGERWTDTITLSVPQTEAASAAETVFVFIVFCYMTNSVAYGAIIQFVHDARRRR